MSELIHAAIIGIQAALNLKGALSAAMWQLILLPFTHFSLCALAIAIVWLRFFWRNKGWAFSGLLHLVRSIR